MRGCAPRVAPRCALIPNSGGRAARLLLTCAAPSPLQRDAVERMEATGMHVVRWKSVAYKDHLYGQNYPEFVRRRGTPLTPLDPPSSLPPLPPGLVVGELPSRPWDSPEAVVPLGTHHFPYVLPEFVGSMTAQEAWERIASLVGEGEGRVLETLREIAAGRAGAEVRPLLRSLAVTAAPGQAVAALLAPAVALGVVSPRQVLAEARRGPVWHSDSYASSMAKVPGGAVERLARRIAAQHDNSTREALLSPQVAELWDWHAQLARVGETGSKLRHWRWAGQLLTNYVVCSPPGSSPDPARPAVLLVHGFGAFAEHWRDNMQPLAARGFDVFAVTLVRKQRARARQLLCGVPILPTASPPPLTAAGIRTKREAAAAVLTVPVA